jgi:hypothetical protein
MQKRRQPEVIAGRINADGTIATGDGFTVAKTGTGTYTVTLGTGLRLMGATATYFGGGTAFVQVSGYTERSFNVATANNTSAAQDLAFSFVAAGVQQ